jgi:hypothetical protein
MTEHSLCVYRRRCGRGLLRRDYLSEERLDFFGRVLRFYVFFFSVVFLVFPFVYCWHFFGDVHYDLLLCFVFIAAYSFFCTWFILCLLFFVLLDFLLVAAVFFYLVLMGVL